MTLEVLTIALFLFTLLSGFYLTFKGKPYSAWWSATHMIGTLILVTSYIMLCYPKFTAAPNATELLSLFYTALGLFVLAIITGAIVVNLKSRMPWLLWSHRILPLLCYAVGAYAWWAVW